MNSKSDTIDAELTEIFNDLSISVYKAEIDTIYSLMEDGKKRTKALLLRERTEAEKAIRQAFNKYYGGEK